MSPKIICAALIMLLSVIPLYAEVNEFHVAWGQVPRNFDPALLYTNFEFNMSLQLFEGVTVLQAGTLVPQPGGATHWEVSEDGLVYTFYLRPDAVWADGTPITAETFRYSWLRVLDPAMNSPYAFFLFYLKHGREYFEGRTSADEVGIEVVSPLTLRMTLTNPTPFFLQLTSFPAYMPVPEHIIQQYGDAWTAPEHLVGNGPFIIAESPSETIVLLHKNSAYWDREKVMLDRVVYHIVNDSSEGIRQYERGEIEWLPWITTNEMGNVFDHPDLLRFPILGTYYYVFNTTRPSLNDPRVREALYLALNRGYICRTILKSGDHPAFGFVPPRIPGYINDQGIRENPERARQLLAEAGYPNGQGFPEFSMLFFDHEEHRLIAEAVQAMWQDELNLYVHLEAQKVQVYREKMRSRDFDLLNSLWVGDYIDPGTFLEMFQAASHDNNLTGWESNEYRALIQQAETEIDPEKRLQQYAQAEHILLEHAPVLPLFHPVAVQLLKPYVEGLEANLMDLHPLKGVTIEPHESADN